MSNVTLVQDRSAEDGDPLSPGPDFQSLVSQATRQRLKAADVPKTHKHRNGKIDMALLVTDPDFQGFVCPYCEFTFAYQHVRNRHVRQIHERHLLDLYQCDRCHYTTVRKDQMKTHYMVVHDCFYPFRCSICAYGAVKEAKIRQHIQEEHKGEGSVTRLKRDRGQEKNVESLRTPRSALKADGDNMLITVHEDGGFEAANLRELATEDPRTTRTMNLPACHDLFVSGLISKAIRKCVQNPTGPNVGAVIQDTVQKACQNYRKEIQELHEMNRRLLRQSIVEGNHVDVNSNPIESYEVCLFNEDEACTIYSIGTPQ